MSRRVSSIELVAYVEVSPDPPALYILRAADGRQLGQYETPEEAEAALVDYQWIGPDDPNRQGLGMDDDHNVDRSPSDW